MHVEPTTVVAVLIGLLDLYAIASAIVRRLGPEATLAWIFAILALPVIGAVSYVMLAGPNMSRATRRKRAAALAARMAAAAARARAAAVVVPPGGEDKLSPGELTLLRLAANITDLEPTGGNAVELLAENERAFERVGEALRGARRTIWAESYIIKKDDTGQRFLDLLVEKARAGVDVRLLYDAVGSFTIDGKRLEALRAAGGRATAFLPMNPLRKRWAVNLRNHRKLIVVDGEIGFTGGMNIGNEYSGQFRRRVREMRRPDPDHFQDSHLRLAGPAVADLSQTFAEDWAFATDEELPLPPVPAPLDGRGEIDLHDADGSAVTAIIPSGPDQEHNANGMVHFAGISSARRRIWIESAYFIPDQALLTALVSSALRGVDVRVLVPAFSDIGLVRAAARSYYPALVRGGVRVFEYQPAMMHSKTIVIDGRWGLVGSANMDIRSFRLNFELSALVMGRAFARTLEQRFEADMAQSVEITADLLRSQGYWARLRDGLARLMSPLL